jgi:Fe2+ or Zn2+ uptake regulation protein
MIVIENISKYLLENGIKPSVQRLKIFEYLSNTYEHPTVETIFNALSEEIPTLSKTTVYNTLRLFQSKGIVNVINIEDNETRYDADTSFHGHFKCTECGKVYDFKVDISKINFKELENFKIMESHFYLKGICKHCLNNNNLETSK